MITVFKFDESFIHFNHTYPDAYREFKQKVTISKTVTFRNLASPLQGNLRV